MTHLLWHFQKYLNIVCSCQHYLDTALFTYILKLVIWQYKTTLCQVSSLIDYFSLIIDIIASNNNIQIKRKPILLTICRYIKHIYSFIINRGTTISLKEINQGYIFLFLSLDIVSQFELIFDIQNWTIISWKSWETNFPSQ